MGSKINYENIGKSEFKAEIKANNLDVLNI